MTGDKLTEALAGLPGTTTPRMRPQYATGGTGSGALGWTPTGAMWAQRQRERQAADSILPFPDVDVPSYNLGGPTFQVRPLPPMSAPDAGAIFAQALGSSVDRMLTPRRP